MNIRNRQFIRTLLQKHNKTAQEVDFLKKAFSTVKFFHQQNLVLHPESVDKLFHRLKWVRKNARDILFQYGQMDHTFYVMLKGSVTVLVPNAAMLKRHRDNTISNYDIRQKTLQLLLKYNEMMAVPQRLLSHAEEFQRYLDIVFEDFDRAKEYTTGDSFGEVALINKSYRYMIFIQHKELPPQYARNIVSS